MMPIYLSDILIRYYYALLITNILLKNLKTIKSFDIMCIDRRIVFC